MPKLTRRTFIKLATAGAGLAVIENTLSPIIKADELIEGGKAVSRTTGLPHRSVPSTCLMCPARCGILAFVEENSVVKIEGNPIDPNCRGRLCAKGQAGVNILYNPDRLLYPIRRKGPRGSGQWIRITWEEALDEVASRLKTLATNMHASNLVFLGGMFEGTGGIAGRLMKAYGATKIFDEAALYTANKTAGQRLTWGADFEVPDLARSRYILNFGANPCESHPQFLPMVQRLVDGQMNGAKLVTFDPRLSGTAARSAEWFPLTPGSDAVVALAMANVIVQRGLYDASFVRSWVNYSIDDLAKYLSQYTIALADRESGVSAANIERIAVEFATAKPATTISGGGASQHANGTAAERAIALLNALTGNVDIVGGYCLPRRYALGEPDPAPIAPKSDECPDCRNLNQLLDAVHQRVDHIGMIINHKANPVLTAPNGALIAEVLKDEGLVPYHVTFDSFLTETAVLADIVLPAATYLESWDVQSPAAFDQVPYVSIMQPAVKPIGESVPFHDTCIELAKRLGGDVASYFSFGTMEAYISAAVRDVNGLDRAGGMDYLKRTGVWFDPGALRAERTYERGGFATPSGKFEVYSPQLAAKNLPALPSVPHSAPPENTIDNQFTLITFQFNVHSYGRTADAMWLSEIAHDNPVWIHPERAAALGIRRGDRVTLTSEVGSIETKAWLTQAINPEVIAIGMGVGRWASSRIAQSKAFKSNEPNTEHLWWEKQGAGVHPYPLIPVASDPVGGGPSWLATRVIISKA